LPSGREAAEGFAGNFGFGISPSALDQRPTLPRLENLAELLHVPLVENV
jgi:hypothetical protein